MRTNFFHGSIQSEPFQLCAGDVIDFHGQRFEPDMTKGYVEFRISHALPVVTAYGTALEAGTIRTSAATMLHQVFNLGHQMKAYYPDSKNMKGDRVLGSIVGVKLVDQGSDNVHIHGVACFAKLAHGMDKVMGQHQGGRHQWTVSMEILYDIDQSGWLLGGPAQDGREGAWDRVVEKIEDEGVRELCLRSTPDAWKRAGLAYLPHSQAPEDMRALYSAEKRAVVGRYRDLPTTLLMGGVSGSVHYGGVGLVPYGAEPTAKVSRLLAEDPAAESATRALDGVAQAIRGFREKVLTAGIMRT